MSTAQGGVASGESAAQPSKLIESHFSWLRTRLSTERTLMSWIRTATALIGFGFTIIQFFARLATTPGVAPARHPGTPRLMGFTLIGIGTVGLIVAIAEYREIRAGGPHPARTPTLIAAVLLALVGILTFAALALRIA